MQGRCKSSAENARNSMPRRSPFSLLSLKDNAKLRRSEMAMSLFVTSCHYQSFYVIICHYFGVSAGRRSVVKTPSPRQPATARGGDFLCHGPATSPRLYKRSMRMERACAHVATTRSRPCIVEPSSMHCRASVHAWMRHRPCRACRRPMFGALARRI